MSTLSKKLAQQRFVQLSWLIFILSVALISFSIHIKSNTTNTSGDNHKNESSKSNEDENNDYLLVLVLGSVGSVLSGVSLTWLVEEVYKKRFKRLDTEYIGEQTMIDVLNIIKSTNNRPILEPTFQRVWHVYYQTCSSNDELFWNYFTLDFTNGFIITTANLFNIEGEAYRYKAELCLHSLNGPLVLIQTAISGGEPPTVSVVRVISTNAFIKQYYGTMFHVDWHQQKLNWRLDPIILSHTNLIKQEESGPIKRKEDSDTLMESWKESYLKEVPVFENLLTEK